MNLPPGYVLQFRAQKALTHFVALERSDRVVLCEVSPVTGRMHQIRVHAEHAGWPIAGDEQVICLKVLCAHK